MLACMPKRKEDTKNMAYAQEFAARLDRALGDMTIAELARLIEQSGPKIAPGRLAHYFSGRNYPDPDILAILCKTLGVSADWAVGLTTNDDTVAELEEKLAAATGEDKINKLMRGMSRAKQKQVLDFAEYLLAKEAGNEVEVLGHKSRLPQSEAERNLAMLRGIIQSVEKDWGTDGREDFEQRILNEINGR